MRPEPTWNGGACAFADGGVHRVDVEAHVDQVHVGEVGKEAIGCVDGPIAIDIKEGVKRGELGFERDH